MLSFCQGNILDLNEKNDYSLFQTPLRTVFELYALRKDRHGFLAYVRSHEQCRHLDPETYEIIGKLIHSSRLLKVQQKSEEPKEVQNMYDVVEELMNDSREEGRIQGKTQGQAVQLIAIIENLMENLHCTLEEACVFTGKTVEEYCQAQKLGAINQ